MSTCPPSNQCQPNIRTSRLLPVVEVCCHLCEVTCFEPPEVRPQGNCPVLLLTDHGQVRRSLSKSFHPMFVPEFIVTSSYRSTSDCSLSSRPGTMQARKILFPSYHRAAYFAKKQRTYFTGKQYLPFQVLSGSMLASSGDCLRK